MKLRIALATATCLALPILAYAQPVTGPYVSLEAGTTLSSSFNYNYTFFDDQNGGDSQEGKFLTRPSYAVLGAIGYGLGDGFRGELSVDFLRSSIHKDDDTVDFGDGPLQTRAYGGQNTYGPMFSVLYDFNVGLPVFPYVGAGIGYQWVKFPNHINDLNDDSDIDGGTEGSFAYNLIAGLSYPLPALPQLSLTAEYRFIQLTSSRNYTAHFDDENESPLKIGQQSYHSFLLGVRYSLFAPPVPAPAPTPAPAASPAPPAAKTYLVFFDWNKYSLTPRADQIIAEAASDSKTSSVTTIDVSGYTDTSGTPTYNQGLSERRAKAVAAKLVVDGVSASEISIHAFGETHLLVPTGPGVREPQNRRVEIVLN